MLHVCDLSRSRRLLSLNYPLLIAITVSVCLSACQQTSLNGGAFPIASLGSVNSTSIATPTPAPLSVGTVVPLYSIASQWNDHYIASAVGTACTGTELNCKHGGELKKVTVTGRASCVGLTATDQLGAFNWICDGSSGAVVFNGNLKPEKSLADLVTATAWKNNSVQVADSGQAMGTTTSSVWWANPVTALPDSSSAPITLSASGTVYVASASAVTQGYNINADKTSIAILSGVTLTGTATLSMNSGTFKSASPDTKVMIAIGTQNFDSIEGSNNWTWGVKPTSGWTLDGNHLVDRYIAFKSTNYTRIKNVDMTNSNAYGMNVVASRGYRMSRLNVCDTPSYGILENTSLSGNFDHINGIDNNNELVDFNSPSNITGQWIYTRNNPGQGAADSLATIWINGATNMNFSHIENHNASCTGLTVRSTTNSFFDQMTFTAVGSGGTVACGAEGGNGIYIRNGSNNTFTNLKVYLAQGSGIRLNAPGLTSFKNVQVINSGINSAFTGRAGIRETGIATGVVTYQNVITSNNGGEGFSIAFTGSVLSEVLSTHNGLSGITINAAATSVTAATLAYNGAHGLNQNFKDAQTTYHNVVSYKNTLAGFYFFDEAVGATLSQVVAQNNGAAGIQMAAPSAGGTARIKMVGNILVGSNTSGACSVPAGTIGIADSNCTPNGSSTASVKTNLDVTSSFIEATATTQPYTAITDFTDTAYAGKAWGRASSLTGACVTGENCRQFDWALKSSDTVLRSRTGDGMSPNENFSALNPCPVQSYGTVSDTKFTGTPAFLRTAIEDISVAGGNHNGLCETGETCIYTPNFGYYQGEGALAACAYQADGGINAVSLSGYSINGH